MYLVRDFEANSSKTGAQPKNPCDHLFFMVQTLYLVLKGR